MPARSRRLDCIPPYLFSEIARIKARARAEGKDIIDLGIGDPDVPTPGQIVEALCKFSHESWTHRYDESPHGLPDFLEAASDWFYRNYQVKLDPQTQLLLLIGSKEGLAHLCWTYCDPGDVVLVPQPGYTVYKVCSLMAGAEVHEMPLRAERGFLPDLGSIPEDLAARAKLMFVCYPNNPTAAIANLDFYREALEFCDRHDILLVNDAAYAQVCYDGFSHPSLLQVPGAAERALEFHSLSKMFNMTGWRLGFAAGCPDVIENLAKLKSNLDSKQFMAISAAGAFALRSADNGEALRLYQRRRDILVGGLRDLGWNVPLPKATFYVWAPVPKGYDSMAFAKDLLERAHIVCIPGVGYGEAGEGYVRMSLTVDGDRDGDRLAEAVRRISGLGYVF
ncbi:MAG: LL-diaminopimelate aminotransferase [Fimbriimonadales bacterium]